MTKPSDASAVGWLFLAVPLLLAAIAFSVWSGQRAAEPSAISSRSTIDPTPVKATPTGQAEGSRMHRMKPATRLTPAPGFRTDGATDSERLKRLSFASSLSTRVAEESPGAITRAVGEDFTVLQVEIALCGALYLDSYVEPGFRPVLRKYGFRRVECSGGGEIWSVDVW